MDEIGTVARGYATRVPSQVMRRFHYLSTAETTRADPEAQAATLLVVRRGRKQPINGRRHREGLLYAVHHGRMGHRPSLTPANHSDAPKAFFLPDHQRAQHADLYGNGRMAQEFKSKCPCLLFSASATLACGEVQEHDRSSRATRSNDAAAHACNNGGD